MSRLTIEASTPLCLLQDAGRFGVRHLGVTQGGAADWCSMSWANWLLGNNLDATVIEITLGGFAVVAEEACWLALAGADLGAQIDGQPLAPWRSFKLGKGQKLQLTQPLLGARAYLAAPGGFDAPQVLGSSATVVREELGGLDGLGLPLAKGAALSYRGESVPRSRSAVGVTVGFAIECAAGSCARRTDRPVQRAESV
jgi:allophanate hydrolase subunit 2